MKKRFVFRAANAASVFATFEKYSKILGKEFEPLYVIRGGSSPSAQKERKKSSLASSPPLSSSSLPPVGSQCQPWSAHLGTCDSLLSDVQKVIKALRRAKNKKKKKQQQQQVGENGAHQERILLVEEMVTHTRDEIDSFVSTTLQHNNSNGPIGGICGGGETTVVVVPPRLLLRIFVMCIHTFQIAHDVLSPLRAMSTSEHHFTASLLRDMTETTIKLLALVRSEELVRKHSEDAASHAAIAGSIFVGLLSLCGITHPRTCTSLLQRDYTLHELQLASLSSRFRSQAVSVAQEWLGGPTASIKEIYDAMVIHAPPTEDKHASTTTPTPMPTTRPDAHSFGIRDGARAAPKLDLLCPLMSSSVNTISAATRLVSEENTLVSETVSQLVVDSLETKPHTVAVGHTTSAGVVGRATGTGAANVPRQSIIPTAITTTNNVRKPPLINLSRCLQLPQFSDILASLDGVPLIPKQAVADIVQFLDDEYWQMLTCGFVSAVTSMRHLSSSSSSSPLSTTCSPRVEDIKLASHADRRFKIDTLASVILRLENRVQIACSILKTSIRQCIEDIREFTEHMNIPLMFPCSMVANYRHACLQNISARMLFALQHAYLFYCATATYRDHLARIPPH